MIDDLKETPFRRRFGDRFGDSGIIWAGEIDYGYGLLERDLGLVESFLRRLDELVWDGFEV